MAFHHRKLTRDPDPRKSSEPICDPKKNPGGICKPIDSVSPCPSIYQDFPPPPPPPPCDPPTSYIARSNHHKLSLPLKISLSILVASFSLFLLFTLFKFYTVWSRSRRQRSSPQPDQEDQETHDDFLDPDHGPLVDHPIWYIRTVGLQPSVISAITIVKYKGGEGLVEGTDCSVCLNEFQEDENLRLLPKCNHAFHLPCIDTWLRSHTNCPLCRAGIVKNTTNSPSPDQVVDNSGLVEETQVGISENDGDSERGGREDEASELRIGIEQENDISKAEVGNSDGLVRRSVSLDSLSASRISAAIANANQAQSDGDLDTQLVKVDQTNLGIVPNRVDVNQSLLRFVGSSSIGRSFQRGPMFMKRSFSCSGKVLLSRHSRRENSIPPS